METLTVAIIGHRKIENVKELREKIKSTVCRLIEEEKAETFLFGNKSEFDDLALAVVTELKETYPFIKRVYLRASYEKIDDMYKEYLLTLYDETFYPCGVKGAGYRSYVVRNRAMIDMCDILVTYYNKDYQPLRGRASGTKSAVEYALKKKKRIINLYD